MSVSSSGSRGQPQFVSSGNPPTFAADLTAVSNYASSYGNRGVGTTTQRNAATAWDGLEWRDTTTGFTYERRSSAWVMTSTNGWVSFTPSWTALTVGNGTQTAFYKVADGELSCEVSLTFGSTTSIGAGNVRMTTPASIVSYPQFAALGYGSWNDVGSVAYMIAPMYISTNLVGFAPFATDGAWAGQGQLMATNVFTPVTADRLSFAFRARTP